MSLLRMIYLALAVAGTALPLWRIISSQARTDWAMLWQLTEWRAFADSYYLTIQWEPVLVALTLSVWILAEVAVRRNWSALWAIPATWAIGVSCGLPLYLFLRTRPVT